MTYIPLGGGSPLFKYYPRDNDSSMAVPVNIPPTPAWEIILIVVFSLCTILGLAFGFSARLRRAVSHLWKKMTETDPARKLTKKLDKKVPAQLYGDWKTKAAAAGRLPAHQDDRNSAYSPCCSICLDDLLDTQQVRGLPCGHVYHDGCLLRWFLTARYNCPLCQAVFYVPGPGEVGFVPPPPPPGDSIELQPSMLRFDML